AVRAIVITGSGDDAFCMGSELGFLSEAFSSGNYALFRSYLVRLNDVLFAIEASPLPVTAMVQGRARAAGFEMMLACDFVFVAEEAVIGDVHTPFGHIPGAGATARLTTKIGQQRALELLMTGEWLTGAQALERGIALRCVPRLSLRRAVDDFLDTL